MAAMIKEETYVAYLGAEEHVLRVQELLWGLEPWPEKFRARIPASAERKAIMVYGTTAREVAERAVEYLSCFSAARSSLSHAKAC